MKYCEFCKTVETHKRFCCERCRSGWRRANGTARGNPNNRKKPKTVAKAIDPFVALAEIEVPLIESSGPVEFVQTVPISNVRLAANSISHTLIKGEQEPKVPTIVRAPQAIEIENAPKDESCYFDECELDVDESIIIEHPDLKRLHLTLRVSLCSKHKYLLREVA